MKLAQQGFTLLELLVILSIIGILSAIVLPQYQNYTERARFSEVILATSPYKVALEVAVQTGRITALSRADAGAFGIPGDTTGATDNVASVAIVNGVITGTGTAAANSDTYVLTPSGVAAPILWTLTGTCIASGSCSL